MWQAIPETNGRYEASDEGQIRNARTLQVLAPCPDRQGYLRVGISAVPNRLKVQRVHQLVMHAFRGPQNGLNVNHKDGNKQNNRLENLEYVTKRENSIHAYATGLMNPPFKITAEQVREVRRMRKETGYGNRKIAKALNLSRGVVQGVLYRKSSWRYLDPTLDDTL